MYKFSVQKYIRKVKFCAHQKFYKFKNSGKIEPLIKNFQNHCRFVCFKKIVLKFKNRARFFTKFVQSCPKSKQSKNEKQSKARKQIKQVNQANKAS